MSSFISGHCTLNYGYQIPIIGKITLETLEETELTRNEGR